MRMYRAKGAGVSWKFGSLARGSWGLIRRLADVGASHPPTADHL